MMSYKTIIFEESDHIATITLNRPDALNAIDQDMREDFERVLDEIQSNDRIRVIIFTGAGRAFSAGGDISLFERDWKDTPKFRAQSRRLMNFFDELEQMEKPGRAAIH